MSILTKNATGILLLCGSILIFFGGLILQYDAATLGGLLAFYVLALFFLYKPLEGFCAILFLRVTLDAFANHYSVQLRDDFSLNLAALFAILLITLTALYIALQHMPQLALSSKILTVLVALFAISTTYSIDPLLTAHETTRSLSILCVIILTTSFAYHEQRKTFSYLIGTIICASIIPLGFALFQLVSSNGLTDTTGFDGRLFGTFAHPNIFAAFLVLAFGVTYYALHNVTILTLYTTNKPLIQFFVVHQKLLLFLTITLSSTLILTFSRGGWFAFLILIGTYSLLRAPKVLFATVGVIAILFFSSDLVHDRIEEIYNPPADSSVRWRFQQWQDVLGAWRAAPLLGYGAGTEVAIHEHEQGFFAGNPYTHNDFLKILQENGVIGFIVYTVLIIITIILLIKKQRSLHDPALRSFVFMVTLIFIAEVAFGMSSNIWRGTAIQWLLWTLVTLALVSEGRSSHKRPQQHRRTATQLLS